MHFHLNTDPSERGNGFALKSLMLGLPRWIKRIFVLALDSALCFLSTYLSISLRFEEWQAVTPSFVSAGILSIAVALPIFVSFGLYRAIFRYSGGSAIWAIIRSMAIYSFFYALAILLLPHVFGLSIPRSIIVIQPLLLLFLVGSSRAWANFWLGDVYRKIAKIDGAVTRILIYGAGSAGRQLANEISHSPNLKVVGFIEDDDRLHGAHLDGIKVSASSQVELAIASSFASEIWLALPSVSTRRRKQIISNLSGLKVVVRTLPSLSELANGQVSIRDIRELDIDDLLNRDVVPPQQLLLTKHIQGKVILITGAAGSIGAELSRQALEEHASVLILLDRNEFGLYCLHQELLQKISSHQSAQERTQIIPILGSIDQPQLLRELFTQHSVHMIYHAAAYKHVPMVEHNLKEGLRNNVFATLTLVQMAAKYRVPHFTLVSTDKAVRPTNVMGASKRLCEKILQAYAQLGTQTNFSMVRFGNVLDSSGSVVPQFRRQIGEGGPVTVTHPEVTRYFMSINEAAQLVIQASSMAEGGEVFLLDMGKPVKIYDLAARMIELSGLTMKTPDSPHGDIEIAITGLRPGEKLYEELLIGNDPQSSAHPKIFKAKELCPPWPELEEGLGLLQNLMDQGDLVGIRALLQKLVMGYVPDAKIVDWSYSGTNEAGGGVKPKPDK
jgi:FlaA1/EpsC-like NDP-sugar epimerase